MATPLRQAWLRISEAPVSNLNPETNYPVVFRRFPPLLPTNTRTVPEIKPLPLPLIFFLIYWLIIMQLHKSYATQTKYDGRLRERAESAAQVFSHAEHVSVNFCDDTGYAHTAGLNVTANTLFHTYLTGTETWLFSLSLYWDSRSQQQRW